MAGFIIYDDTAIWGFGSTESAAWADFRDGMARAGIVILTDEQEAPEYGPSSTRESTFHAMPATDALIDMVAGGGGAVAWAERGGMACTNAEENTYKILYLVSGGEAIVATGDETPDGTAAIFAHAYTPEDALDLARRYDAGEIQPDNVQACGQTIGALT